MWIYGLKHWISVSEKKKVGIQEGDDAPGQPGAKIFSRKIKNSGVWGCLNQIKCGPGH